jgi:hypothetical protein
MSERSERCIHGMDWRMCALCSRAQRERNTPSIPGILFFLNEARIRATYGAVADAVGVRPDFLSAQLGDRRPEASWVVRSDDGLPTAYTSDLLHPELLHSPEIIRSASELVRRMKQWRAARSNRL